MEIAAWIILRVVYAWMFLYPLITLLSDWQATENTVALVFPWAKKLFSLLMVLIMVVGAISILLGAYAQIAGILLFFYCMIGAVVHYRLAKLTAVHVLSNEASEADKAALKETIALGVVGHVTSAQKNFVLAAVGLFFFFMGSGPLSLTGSFW